MEEFVKNIFILLEQKQYIGRVFQQELYFINENKTISLDDNDSNFYCMYKKVRFGNYE